MFKEVFMTKNSSIDTEISKKFDYLLHMAKEDSNVTGFILLGSRGKGFENEYSDYDIIIIAEDNFLEICKEKYEKEHSEKLDLGVLSLSEFENYAEWSSQTSWDRYTFSHVKALVDKTGEIQRMIDLKGQIPESVRNDVIADSLDAYINQVYRSMKCFRTGNIVGARLEASREIPYLLDFIFALHNRLKPFYGYLEKELKSYPLEKMPWKTEDFLRKILLILSTADIDTQQELLKSVEILSRKEGFGKVFDDWTGRDKWAMTYKPLQSEV
jgi:predicted nucleotidyltransferase